ncbi:MAG: PQQ-binding-like beta-propeller repeat protein [Gemmataceae bacterium]
MKRLTWTLLAAALTFAASTAPSEAEQLPRAKLYSQPVPPPRALLDRLNLQMSFRYYVPMDGRRDGLATVQLHGRDLLVQTRSGLVTLMDAETGAALWRQRVGRDYVAEHALAFNSREIYVVNNVHLYALDRLTGAVNWHYRLPEGVAAAPVADENLLYVPTPTGRLTAYLLPRPDLLAGKPGRKIETREERYKRLGALRADTGGSTTTVSHLTTSVREAHTAEEEAGPRPTRVWSEVASLRLELPLVLTNDRVMVPTPNGIVLAMGKRPQVSGLPTQSYRFPTGSPIRMPAGYIDGVAYVGAEDGDLYALETTGGRLRWRYTGGVPISRRPASTEEDVYIVAARQGMTRLDRATGLPKWRIPTRGGLVETNAAANYFLAANPKYVYALDASGHFLVLDRRRGVTLSGFDSRDFVFPISNDVTDRVYLAANNGLIVCLHDRAYPKPIRHRKREEEAEDPIRLRLEQPLNDVGTPEMPLSEMLVSWSRRFPPLRFRIEEEAFHDAMLESPARALVKMPNVKDKPLRTVLKDMLAAIKCTYEIIGDTIVILPAAPAPAKP